MLRPPLEQVKPPAAVKHPNAILQETDAFGAVMADSMKRHAEEQKEKLPHLRLTMGASVRIARALPGVGVRNRS